MRADNTHRKGKDHCTWHKHFSNKNHPNVIKIAVFIKKKKFLAGRSVWPLAFFHSTQISFYILTTIDFCGIQTSIIKVADKQADHLINTAQLFQKINLKQNANCIKVVRYNLEECDKLVLIRPMRSAVMISGLRQ